MISTNRSRCRQISLRGMLLCITLAAVLFGWCGWRLQRMRIEQAAGNAIIQAGGEVAYSNQFDGGVSRLTPLAAQPSRVGAWLSELLGADPLRRIISVKIMDDESASLVSNYALTDLEIIRLEGPGITDAALAHIRDCKEVRVLSLDGAQVTDRGLDQFRRYKLLEELWLHNTPISDAGLKKITGIESLAVLDIRSTSITDDGLSLIASMPAISLLYLESITLTDAGLKHLCRAPNLHGLWLGEQSSSRFDLDALSEFSALKNLTLTGPSMTDAALEPLANNNNIESLRLQTCAGLTDRALSIIATMPNLRYINVRGTPFSTQALAKFRREHPNCSIR